MTDGMLESVAVTLLRAGESQRAVARQLGVNPVTVGRIARRAGIRSTTGGARSAEARRGITLRQTERAFQDQVVAYARLCGWLVFHPWSSRHSASGWPDLALVRPPRFVVAELKAEDGKVTAAQQTWLNALDGCLGVEVFVWKPSDWKELEEVLR